MESGYTTKTNQLCKLPRQGEACYATDKSRFKRFLADAPTCCLLTAMRMTVTTMQQFTNLSYTTTKQHKDSPEARVKRDAVDLETISYKPVASPFSPDSSL